VGITVKALYDFSKYADNAAIEAAFPFCGGSTNEIQVSSTTPFGVGKSLHKPATETSEYTRLRFSGSALGMVQADYHYIAFRMKLDDTIETFQLGLWAETNNTQYCQYLNPGTNLNNFSIAWDPVEKTVIAYNRTYQRKVGDVSVDLNDGNWHSIEITVHRSGSGGCRVWIDNTLVLSVDNVNLAYSTANAVGIGYRMRDVYFSDIILGVAEAVTDRLTPDASFAVRRIPVMSDATPNEWTVSGGSNHYELVDELTHDDDATYLESSGAGQEERFGVSLGSDIANVFALEYGVRLRGLSATEAMRKVEIFADSNGSEDKMDVGMITGTNYGSKVKLLNTNPDGGGALSKTVVNAMKFGFRTTV